MTDQMTDRQKERLEFMLEAARRMAQIDEYGALHIVVSDGNMEDDSLDFCRGLPNITADETAFLEWFGRELTEAERFGAYALAEAA